MREELGEEKNGNLLRKMFSRKASRRSLAQPLAIAAPVQKTPPNKDEGQNGAARWEISTSGPSFHITPNQGPSSPLQTIKCHQKDKVEGSDNSNSNSNSPTAPLSDLGTWKEVPMAVSPTWSIRTSNSRPNDERSLQLSPLKSPRRRLSSASSLREVSASLRISTPPKKHSRLRLSRTGSVCNESASVQGSRSLSMRSRRMLSKASSMHNVSDLLSETVATPRQQRRLSNASSGGDVSKNVEDSTSSRKIHRRRSSKTSSVRDASENGGKTAPQQRMERRRPSTTDSVRDVSESGLEQAPPQTPKGRRKSSNAGSVHMSENALEPATPQRMQRRSSKAGSVRDPPLENTSEPATPQKMQRRRSSQSGSVRDMGDNAVELAPPHRVQQRRSSNAGSVRGMGDNTVELAPQHRVPQRRPSNAGSVRAMGDNAVELAPPHRAQQRRPSNADSVRDRNESAVEVATPQKRRGLSNFSLQRDNTTSTRGFSSKSVARRLLSKGFSMRDVNKDTAELALPQMRLHRKSSSSGSVKGPASPKKQSRRKMSRVSSMSNVTERAHNALSDAGSMRDLTVNLHDSRTQTSGAPRQSRASKMSSMHDVYEDAKTGISPKKLQPKPTMSKAASMRDLTGGRHDSRTQKNTSRRMMLSRASSVHDVCENAHNLTPPQRTKPKAESTADSTRDLTVGLNSSGSKKNARRMLSKASSMHDVFENTSNAPSPQLSPVKTTSKTLQATTTSLDKEQARENASRRKMLSRACSMHDLGDNAEKKTPKPMHRRRLSRTASLKDLGFQLDDPVDKDFLDDDDSDLSSLNLKAPCKPGEELNDQMSQSCMNLIPSDSASEGLEVEEFRIPGAKQDEDEDDDGPDIEVFRPNSKNPTRSGGSATSSLDSLDIEVFRPSDKPKRPSFNQRSGTAGGAPWTLQRARSERALGSTFPQSTEGSVQSHTSNSTRGQEEDALIQLIMQGPPSTVASVSDLGRSLNNLAQNNACDGLALGNLDL